MWDHPRLCGEKSLIHTLEKKRSGSPPPMRGKAQAPKMRTIRNRITPAYAGKRNHFPQCNADTQDHPRLCGEKTKKITKQRYFFHQPASFSFSLQYT